MVYRVPKINVYTWIFKYDNVSFKKKAEWNSVFFLLGHNDTLNNSCDSNNKSQAYKNH